MEVDAGSRPPAAVLTEPPSATRCEIRGWNCVNALFTSLRGCCVWGKRGGVRRGKKSSENHTSPRPVSATMCHTAKDNLKEAVRTLSFLNNCVIFDESDRIDKGYHSFASFPRLAKKERIGRWSWRALTVHTHTEKGSQPLGRFTWILFFLSPLPSFLPSPSSSHDRLGPFLSWYWQKRVAGWCLTSIERDAWERKHHPLFGPRQYWGRWKAYMDQSPFSMFNCHRERDAPFVPWPEEWVQARGGAPDSSATLIDSSIIPAQRHRIDSTLFWSSRNAG